ncbi:MAG: discoidin domain-containing protein [Deltaproteobacteria bacterium]|nr:discoidin domain-containing protein [Deltaproteobacteria bacterium]
MFGLILALLIQAPPPETAGVQDPALVPVKVSASTSKSGFGPEMAIDGRKDTAWRPDAEATFNLWQWVRFDFGREVEITRMEIDNGVWQVPGEEESFCARGHARWDVHAEGLGAVILESDFRDQWQRFVGGQPGSRVKSIKTRTLTLRVRSNTPSRTQSWDTGLTEVRFFGRVAGDQVPESGPVTCGSRRLFELRDAVLDHCAKSKPRPNAECRYWLSYFEWCHQANIARESKWLPIPEERWAGPRLELTAKDARNPPFPSLGAAFVRDAQGRWKVDTLTCLRGKTPCGPYHRMGSDTGDVSDPEKLTPTSCQMLDGRILQVDGTIIVPVSP